MKKVIELKYFFPSLLVFTSCIYYFSILLSLGGIDFVQTSLFQTGDSKEYQIYAEFIAGKIDYCSPVRTYFYPLCIYLANGIGGNYFIWFFQFLFWLGALVLIYLTVLQHSKNKFIAIGAALLGMLNFSMIVYSANALTETLAFFLLALIAYQLKNISSQKGKLVLLLLLSILTATKPSFVYLLFIFLIFTLWECRRILIKKPALLLLLFLTCCPVFIQLAINKKYNGRWYLSDISTLNLKEYMYRKVKFYVVNSTETDCSKAFDEQSEQTHQTEINLADSLPTREVANYLLHHPGTTLLVYSDNLMENIRSGNPYINKEKHYTLHKLSENLNHNFALWIHIIVLLSWIYFIIRSFLRKNYDQNHHLIWLGIICYYVIATTGITFWAGDRLIASLTSLLAIFIPLLLFHLRHQNHQSFHHIPNSQCI